eukprot:CAMPEP_0197853928 /NCGR_PEP_ID=MMETSP1438-20131217/23704_1 /TAXON_ID=1461541 /ORGANISM="Pterosperma sp., Strain CCMP1384" /LENGTH=559 /DNA_ID=CAMNT_0043468505 /DNA_START=206 /DNA_END=1885 /DNA_ORIENTATION=-
MSTNIAASCRRVGSGGLEHTSSGINTRERSVALLGSKCRGQASRIDTLRSRSLSRRGNRVSTIVTATYEPTSEPNGEVSASSWSNLWKNDWKTLSDARDQALRSLGLMSQDNNSNLVAEQQEQLYKLEAQLEEANQQVLEAKAIADRAVKQLTSLQQSASTEATASAVASTSTATATAEPPSTTTTSIAAPLVQKSKKQRANGLKSSLELSENLKRFWYPVEFTKNLTSDTLIPITLFNEPWVLFRDGNGDVGCIRDECAHRACPLSLGQNHNGCVQCPYHGWEFNKEGECENMPSTVHSGKGLGIRKLECKEDDNMIFVWPAEGVSPDLELPYLGPPNSDYHIHAEIVLEVPVEHGLLLENLLDLAHAPFTHTSTFAKGWPVPDIVKFKAQSALTGNWDPYPIDMSFLPPACVHSTIGLNKPGDIERGMRAEQCKNHLHQLHVCLPAKNGGTRLLYRMSLDFIPWVKHVPGIDLLWKEMANQVLGEDLVLVQGQQERMEEGGDTWNAPVAYDKLAVRYRRWRNGLDKDGGASEKTRANVVTMSAMELFDEEEDEDTPF